MHFWVLKEPVRRVLALTETCLVERDPATYNIVTLKPLEEVGNMVSGFLFFFLQPPPPPPQFLNKKKNKQTPHQNAQLRLDGIQHLPIAYRATRGETES